MVEEKQMVKKPHHLILQDRRELSVSGILEVVSFDENMVVAATELGELTIRGEHLHISKTNVETGELVMDGDIFDLSYAAPRVPKGSFFSRVFK